MLALERRRGEEIWLHIPGVDAPARVVLLATDRGRATIGVEAHASILIERKPDSRVVVAVGDTRKCVPAGSERPAPSEAADFDGRAPLRTESTITPGCVDGPLRAPVSLSLDCAVVQHQASPARYMCGRLVDLVVVLGLMVVTAVAPFLIADWARSEGLMR